MTTAFAAATPLAIRPSGAATCAPQRQLIRAAKHVQKKATKKHMDRRPKKSRPSDKFRKPPPYDVDPLHAAGMPAEYTVAVAGAPHPEQPDFEALGGLRLTGLSDAPPTPHVEVWGGAAPAAVVEAPAADVEEPAAVAEEPAPAEAVTA